MGVCTVVGTKGNRFFIPSVSSELSEINPAMRLLFFSFECDNIGHWMGKYRTL